MAKQSSNEQVLKAISIGLAAVIATTAPMTVSAHSDSGNNHMKCDSLNSKLSGGETASTQKKLADKQQELAAAQSVEAAKQTAYDNLRKQTMEEAKAQYEAELEEAKYEFDFAQSVVGDIRWIYERALYAYQTARANYKQYRKTNWRFWQWMDSAEYKALVMVRNEYDAAHHSLTEEQNRMNAAEDIYAALNTQVEAERYLNTALCETQKSQEYRSLIEAQNEVSRLETEKDALEVVLSISFGDKEPV